MRARLALLLHCHGALLHAPALSVCLHVCRERVGEGERELCVGFIMRSPDCCCCCCSLYAVFRWECARRAGCGTIGLKGFSRVLVTRIFAYYILNGLYHLLTGCYYFK